MMVPGKQKSEARSQKDADPNPGILTPAFWLLTPGAGRHTGVSRRYTPKAYPESTVASVLGRVVAYRVL
jgi:hypothetical protein